MRRSASTAAKPDEIYTARVQSHTGRTHLCIAENGFPVIMMAQRASGLFDKLRAPRYARVAKLADALP